MTGPRLRRSLGAGLAGLLVALQLPLLLAGAAGCEGDEARQVRGAFEDFIDFGMSNEERAKAPPAGKGKRPHLNERSRRLVTKGPRTPRLEVVVDLPHHLDSGAVEAALEIEMTRLLDEGRYAAVELDGRPAGLLKRGGLMGRATARRRQSGEVDVNVEAFVRDDRPALTKQQYDALVDLELAEATAGPGGAAKARAAIRERHGADVVESALSAARARWSRR